MKTIIFYKNGKLRNAIIVDGEWNSERTKSIIPPDSKYEGYRKIYHLLLDTY